MQRFLGEWLFQSGIFDTVEGPLFSLRMDESYARPDLQPEFAVEFANSAPAIALPLTEPIALVEQVDPDGVGATITQPNGALRTAFSGAATDVKFSSDGTRLYVAWGSKVTVFDVASGAQLNQYEMGQTVGAIDLSADGLYLAVVLQTGNFASHAAVNRITLQTGSVAIFDFALGGGITGSFYDVAFLQNGRILLSQGGGTAFSGSLVELDPSVGTFTTHAGPAANATLITGDAHSRVFVLDPTILWRSRVFTADSGITAVRTDNPDPYAGASIPPGLSPIAAVSPNETTFLQGDRLVSSDSSLTGGTQHSFNFAYYQRGMVYSPTGDKIYIMLASNLVVSFDAATWQPLAVYPTGAPGGGASSGYGDGLQISADGRYLSVQGVSNVALIDLQSVIPTGTNGADFISENGTIIGLAGDDTLDSLTGGQMYGGTGDDNYIVNSSGDEPIEAVDEGYDTVLLGYPGSYTMTVGIERVVITTAAGANVYGTNEANQIEGGSGNDTIQAWGGADTIYGYGGDDYLNGEAGNDIIAGGQGADTLNGGDGDDRLYSDQRSPTYVLPYPGVTWVAPVLDTGIAHDILNGGSGDDIIFAGYGDTVDGGTNGDLGDQLLISFVGAPSGVVADFRLSSLSIGGGTITGIERFTWVEGSNFDDTIISNGNPYSLSETIFGMGGNDTITASYHTGSIFGGDGNDVLDGRPSQYIDLIEGNDGDDTIYGGRAFKIIGGEGNDTLTGEGFIAGGNGNDIIYLVNSNSGYNEQVTGGDGDDTIYASTYGGSKALLGQSGNDTMYGDVGNDVLDGGSGINSLFGGAGNDRLIVDGSGSGSSVDGGADSDTLEVNGNVILGSVAGLEVIQLNSGSTLTLSGAQYKTGFVNPALSGSGALVIKLKLIDPVLSLTGLTLAGSSTATITVNGSTGNDQIKGALGFSHTINGGDGVDQIRGGNLVDTINGGNGNDKIMGLGGADILTGGAGADQFRIIFTTDSGIGAAADHITDFVPGSDKLDFRALDADPVAPGQQLLTYIDTQAFHAAGAAEVRYAVSGANLLVEVDLNGDGVADMQIVLDNDGALSLSNGDFLL